MDSTSIAGIPRNSTHFGEILWKWVNSGVLGVRIVLAEPVAGNSMYYYTILVILRGRFGGIPLNSTPFHQLTPILGHIHGNHLKLGILGFWGGKHPSWAPGDGNTINLAQ